MHTHTQISIIIFAAKQMFLFFSSTHFRFYSYSRERFKNFSTLAICLDLHRDHDVFMLCFRKTRSVWITICEDFEECQSSSVFYDGNDNLCEYFCILVQFLLFMQNVLILLLSYYFFINKIYFWNSIKVIEQIINVDFWIFFSSSLLFVECFFSTPFSS